MVNGTVKPGHSVAPYLGSATQRLDQGVNFYFDSGDVPGLAHASLR